MVLDPEKAAIKPMISPRFAGRLLLACGDIQLEGSSIFLRVMLYEFAFFFFFVSLFNGRMPIEFT